MTFHHARVIARGAGRSLAVTCEEVGSLCVGVAAGCLLRPGVGDVVLISVSEDKAYIITVLEHATQNDAPTVLDLGDGVSLSALDGALSIEADHADLRFASCDWYSGALHCHGEQAHFVWREHSAWSERRSEVAVESRECFGDSDRRIGGHEEHRANSLRQTVEQDWVAQAADLTLFGVDRLKADTNGDIQLG
ncbi:DUF3540 domain-containing protein [Paraburkholderia sediminicola]|uniref:DUF3540 domain-containing protein n=1 Tax=Paraburkholderia sediminicola TaxID=458836 RepID=UPI0038B90F18